MYVDEPPKDGNIPDFNISKIDICPFRAYQRSFRLFQGDFSKDIHQRSRLLCFTQNDHTGQTGFKICPFLKWTQYSIFASSEVKGVIAPYGRWGVKTTVFLAYFLSSKTYVLTPLTPLTSWYAKVQEVILTSPFEKVVFTFLPLNITFSP